MSRQSKPDFLNVVVNDGRLADEAIVDRVLNHPFPEAYEARWLRTRRRLVQAGYGDAA